MRFITIFLCSIIPIHFYSQDVDIGNLDLPARLEIPIQPSLYSIASGYHKNPQRAKELIDLQQVIIRDGKINIRVYHPKNYGGIPQSLVNDFNVRVYNVGMKYSCVYADPQDIIGLAENLPQGYYITQDYAAEPHDEGPNEDVHNSIEYVASGPGGSGIKIAIIDVGFSGLLTAITNGRAPADFDSTDYSGTGVLNGSGHGTSVTETVFDHAPGASYFLYKVTNESECEQAVIDAHTEGVDIMNMSLGYRNIAWNDDSCSLCTAVNDAADDGILVFVSAGNSKRLHWQGMFTDNDNDNIHEWAANDELNLITLQDQTIFRVACIWDPSQGTDYDVFVMNQQGTGSPLASNVQSGTAFESFSFTANAGFALPVTVMVQRVSGPAVNFEIQCRTDGTGGSVVNDQLERVVNSGSIQWPASCSSPNVLGVAGVIDDDFDSAPGSVGIDEVYSSEGPTNDGNRGVDITGATRTTIGASGSFFGTSCASPNCAGAAAALWSTQPSLNADNIRYLLFKKADLYNDWGAGGADPIFGNGGLRLYDYYENTKYVDVDVSNPGGLSSRVYQYISHAHSALPAPPAEGAIIIFGDDYPDPYTPLNFQTTKNFIMRSLGPDSILGDN